MREVKGKKSILHARYRNNLKDYFITLEPLLYALKNREGRIDVGGSFLCIDSLMHANSLFKRDRVFPHASTLKGERTTPPCHHFLFFFLLLLLLFFLSPSSPFCLVFLVLLPFPFSSSSSSSSRSKGGIRAV